MARGRCKPRRGRSNPPFRRCHGEVAQRPKPSPAWVREMASLALAMTTTRVIANEVKQSPTWVREIASLSLLMTDGGEGDGVAIATHNIITRPPLAEGGNRVWLPWLANGLYRTSSVPVLIAWRHAHIVLCYFYFEYRLSAV